MKSCVAENTAGSIVHFAGGGGRIHTEISESFHGLFLTLTLRRTLSAASRILSDTNDATLLAPLKYAHGGSQTCT